MSATIAAPVDWVEAVGNLHLPVKADLSSDSLKHVPVSRAAVSPP